MANTSPSSDHSDVLTSPDAQRWVRVLVVLSLMLIFFAVPHTLEDFAAGEPLKKGVPAPVLSLVVSMLLSSQAAGLYWLGQRRRRGVWVHGVLGVLWPLAAGVAQLPMILGPDPYRDGPISVAYVVGLLVLGPCMVLTSTLTLRAARSLP
ncbi:MAG: peptidoglycan/LPS O-acetylase OafA/YrhL [Myxococcota bacterium]|jgi:peptidoglycan/LPS O-acetylase OafA/YrhL